MRHSKLDWFLIVCFATLASWSGYKLYAPSTSNDFDANSFARLEKLTNVVKSKTLGELGWADVKAGQGFKRKDQIYTYQDSRATLNMQDGQRLTLLPNTLIELDQAQGALALQVKEGLVFLDVKKGEKLSLNLDGQEITVSGDDAQVKLSRSGDKVKLESQGGDIDVESADGQQVKLKEKTALEIGENTRFEVSEYTATLVLPKDNAIIRTEENQATVNFNWIVKNKADTKVQIASQYNFENYKEFTDRKITLETGSYYWRVVDSKQRVLSSVNTFEIQYFPAPWIRSDENQPDNYEFDEDRVIRYNLAWDHPSARDFELEIDFNGVKKSIPLNSFRYQVALEKIGTWNFRVRVKADEIESSWSKVKTVSVNAIAPIQLLGPSDDSTIALSEPGEMVNLSFEGEGVVEISKDQDFSKILIDDEASNSYQWKVSETGTFYWRVKQGNRQSLPRKIIISPAQLLPAPQIERVPSEIKLKVIKPSSSIFKVISNAYAQDFAADFEWQELDGAKSYQIEFFSDEKASSLIKKAQTNQAFYRWVGAPLRTIWWRVSAIDGWGRLGNPSIVIKSQLVAPSGWEDTEVALNEPAHGAKLEKDQPVIFEWDSSPGVETWTWMLSNDLSFSNPKYTQKIKGQKLEQLRLPEGTWYWRVEAKDKLGRLIQSRRRRIEVFAVDPVEVARREERAIQYESRLKIRSPFDIELGLLSAKPSYEQTRGPQTFTLSGISASGFHMNLSRKINKWRGIFNVDWVSGKAFDNLGYTDAQAKLLVEKPWNLGISYPLWLAFGVGYSKISAYRRAPTSNELSSEDLSSIGVTGQVTLEPIRLSSSFIQLSAKATMLGRSVIGFDLRQLWKRWYWGVGFESTSQKEDETNEVSASTIRFNLGYRWQRDNEQ